MTDNLILPERDIDLVALPHRANRILGGVRPSARDCFGCHDLEIRQYPDRKIPARRRLILSDFVGRGVA